MTSKKPLSIFIAYAHEDDLIRERLCVHLNPLIKDGLIHSWNDREITPGTDWRGAIDERLDSADIILLLISADFIHSEYCYDIEMNRAIEHHEAGTAYVIPVIVRACDWKGLRFGGLNALPKNGSPIQKADSLDIASTDIALTQVSQEIRKLVENSQELKLNASTSKGPSKRENEKQRIMPKINPNDKLLKPSKSMLILGTILALNTVPIIKRIMVLLSSVG